MAKVNYDVMAFTIIEKLGGKDNLKFLNHCATRLRVNVKDLSKVDEEGLKKTSGVLGLSVIETDNEVQVIVGQVIEDVFSACTKQVGNLSGGSSSSTKGKGLLGKFSNFLMMMAGIMSPIIPALLAAGLLSVFMLILEWCGMDSESSTISILYNLQQSVFYFLPIYVAYTSAKKFDTEPVLAMVLGAFLLYPNWSTMVSELTGQGLVYTSYFGIPTMLKTYGSSVIQSVIAVYVMSKVDKGLKKILPVSVRHVLKPFLLLLIMSILTLPIIAPLGAFISDYIYAGMTWIRNTVPWLAVFAIVVFSRIIGVFMPGFHMALMPVAVQSIADIGYDDLINIWFYCCTLTPAFLALAVGLKSKNKNCKNVAFPASLSAFFGISEPTTYGILYKVPTLYWISFVIMATTGLIAGIMGLKSYGFGAYSLTNILLFLGPNKDWANFRNALILLAIMAIMSFVLVYAIKWDDSVFTDDDNDSSNNPFATLEKDDIEDKEPEVTGDAIIAKPSEGTYIPMAEINDPAISEGALGQCFGIKPENGNVVSPINGIINSVAPTKHAITIYGEHGEQVMVHIGLDSVKLNGMGLQALVKAGQKVKAGQSIANYQKKMFDAEGIDDTIVTFLLNSNAYSDVKFEPENDKAILVAKK